MTGRPARKPAPEKTRLNIRLPVEIDVWAKTYAREHHTTVTRLIVDYLTELKKRTESGYVEQV